MKCFVVGNGTSLNETDVDMLAGTPSFACNRINLLYPEKNWRPDYYVHPESLAPDLPYIRENIELGVECWIGEHFAPPPIGVMDIQDAPNVHWLKNCHHHIHDYTSSEVPDEWHMPQPCSFGGSVNVAMQLAVLMGFDEIVLLGCDLKYNRKSSHFSQAYEHGGEQEPFIAARNALFGHLQALNWIRRKKKNIKVWNATPGGLLELWERIGFEDAL